MNPEKKITATMKTTPATMPTQAATAGSLDRREWNPTAGLGALTTGPLSSSFLSAGDVDSLMSFILVPGPERQLGACCESAMSAGVSKRR
jgi:hypothetical protein